MPSSAKKKWSDIRNEMAIPTTLVCRQRSERINAIGKQLLKGEYDIVLLQEIWSQKDYETLCNKVLTVMPHTHYWHSGMIGSGVCIFSKHYIQETFQHNYGVNGYAHKVLHGDWYGGKCVGLARIVKDDFKINVYATHLHAGYGNEGKYFRSTYQPHRITQAYEMSQFIRFTSEACDAVIVGGDFNFRPDSLGYKIIKFNANLEDAWVTQRENKQHGITSNHPSNNFTKPGTNGGCIDYLMYRANSGTGIECEVCQTVMGKVPGKDYNYSDHEGVMVQLALKRKVTVMSHVRNFAEVEKTFSEAIPVLDSGIKHVQADQVFYTVVFLLSLMMLIFTADLVLPFGINAILTLLRVAIVIGSGFCLWMGTVMANREMNGLLSAKKDINNLLKSNPVT